MGDISAIVNLVFHMPIGSNTGSEVFSRFIQRGDEKPNEGVVDDVLASFEDITLRLNPHNGPDARPVCQPLACGTDTDRAMVDATMTLHRLTVLLVSRKGCLDSGSAFAVVVFEWGKVVVFTLDDLTTQFF